MAILEIIQYPDKRLNQPTKKVEDVLAPHVQQVIADMLETLAHTESCAGLSANQLVMNDPPRITVIAPLEPGDKTLVLVNPEIVEQEGSQDSMEGCMSVYPGDVSAKVKRAKRIICRALDRDGKSVEISDNSYLGICLQHEIDHLDGILYIDHLSPLKRRLLDKKIKKIRSRM